MVGLGFKVILVMVRLSGSPCPLKHLWGVKGDRYDDVHDAFMTLPPYNNTSTNGFAGTRQVVIKELANRKVEDFNG